MNYIELINQFWQTRRRVEFTSNETDLYFFLLQESNVRNWENPFECSNRTICLSIGMSEKTLIDVRNRLQQKGLVTFVAGQRKKKSPVYTILYFPKVSKNDSITVSNDVSKNDSITVNHILKHKQETETKEIEKKAELNYPFSSSLFLDKWNLLASSPKWKVKATPSLQIALDGLKKFDEAFVLEMIDQAIVGEWSVFKGVELSEQYTKWKNQKEKPVNPTKETQNRFKTPTIQEVKSYCLERKNNVDPQKFVDFYQSKGWLVGKSKMKDWEACVRTWEKETPQNGKPLIDLKAIERVKEAQEIKEKAKVLSKEIQQSVSERIKKESPKLQSEEFIGLWDRAWKAEFIAECEKIGIDKSIYNQFFF